MGEFSRKSCLSKLRTTQKQTICSFIFCHLDAWMLAEGRGREADVSVHSTNVFLMDSTNKIFCIWTVSNQLCALFACMSNWQSFSLIYKSSRSDFVRCTSRRNAVWMLLTFPRGLHCPNRNEDYSSVHPFYSSSVNLPGWLLFHISGSFWIETFPPLLTPCLVFMWANKRRQKQTAECHFFPSFTNSAKLYHGCVTRVTSLTPTTLLLSTTYIKDPT